MKAYTNVSEIIRDFSNCEYPVSVLLVIDSRIETASLTLWRDSYGALVMTPNHGPRVNHSAL